MEKRKEQKNGLKRATSFVLTTALAVSMVAQNVSYVYADNDVIFTDTADAETIGGGVITFL